MTESVPTSPFQSPEDRTATFAQKVMADALVREKITIREELFASRWLGFFLEREFGDRDKLIVNAWVIDVAKNATNPVEIINSKNETVAIIPPIVATSKVTAPKNNLLSFSHIVAEASNHNAVFPGSGETIMKNAHKLIHFTDYDNSNEFWLTLFDYFKVDIPTYLKERGLISDKTSIKSKTEDTFDMGNFNED